MSKEADSKKIDYIQDKLDDVASTCVKIDKEVALQKAAFDDHLEQDERMYQEFRRMNDILQQNTDSLREHMHRSDLLESLVEKMDSRFSPIEIEFQRKAAVREWLTVKLKFIAKLGAAVTAVGAIWIYAGPLLKALIQFLAQ